MKYLQQNLVMVAIIAHLYNFAACASNQPSCPITAAKLLEFKIKVELRQCYEVRDALLTNFAKTKSTGVDLTDYGQQMFNLLQTTGDPCFKTASDEVIKILNNISWPQFNELFAAAENVGKTFQEYLLITVPGKACMAKSQGRHDMAS